MEYAEWITGKFSEKKLWFKWLRLFLLALFYWVFGFCRYLLLFFSQWHVVMSYRWFMIFKHPAVSSKHKLASRWKHLKASVESFWILRRWYYRFSQKFRGFNVFFIVTGLIVMSYWWPMNERYHWFPFEAELSVFILKAIEIMALKIVIFPKNFGVLIYLFVFFNSFWETKKYHSC